MTLNAALFPFLLTVHGVLHGHGRVKLVGTLLPAPLHRLLLLLLWGQVGVVVVRDRRGLRRMSPPPVELAVRVENSAGACRARVGYLR